jgi:TrwC relaxase
MERTAYPFPLAVNSSHHSHYHRFLLGADASILAPFPKPYCVGRLATEFSQLAGNLDLQRWRKLYHASFPWTAGFGQSHYALGNVPAHRPLPPEYGRPVRKFGAFDLVLVADPSVSALALVAGDRRIIGRFTAMGDDFCERLEIGVSSNATGTSGSRETGRMLAAQFAEPNNRWLMPFLHVHCRVLNLTSFSDAPRELDCIDSRSLARSGQSAMRGWLERQAQLLGDLGYRARVGDEPGGALRVEGVCPRLLAAVEAPRIAVIRILEKAVAGERAPSADRLFAELPPAVIAAMAEQLESLVARSLSRFKPAKLEVPAEGPWRSAVREHLSHYCPGSLEQLDRTAARARAEPIESAIFPTPPLDPAHRHAPCAADIEAAHQLPCDPDLGGGRVRIDQEPLVPLWLARDFDATLRDVNERIVRAGPGDPLVSLRRIFPTIDHLSLGAEPAQLRQAAALLGVELERRSRDAGAEIPLRVEPARGDRPALASLESLFEELAAPGIACEREIGGRSL